jgi:inosine-uridine nucleoside N-ribohydrolase
MGLHAVLGRSVLVGLVVVLLCACPGQCIADVKRPVPIIFDTDIGNDVDDVLALGVAHALESRGECKLLAVTITKDHPLCAPFVDAVNTFYGRGDVPIGVVRNGFTPEDSKFLTLATVKDGGKLRYPHDLMSSADAPDAVGVLRKTLAGAEDNSVVIVQVGLSTNLARLLKSPPDNVSPLSGMDLVRKKVRLLSIMAGAFEVKDKPEPEYNIKLDLKSSRALVADWPTPVLFSGVEIGMAVPYPAVSNERDFAYVLHHPLAEAYVLYYPPPHERPCWDLTSVLYAVRPNDAYFDLSPAGRVHVAEDGVTTFKPESGGPHRHLILKHEQAVRVREALRELASQPPTKNVDAK